MADLDACVTDIAQQLEDEGRRNGQRWIVDTAALRATLSRYLAAPAPKRATKKKAPKKAAADDS